MPLWPHAPDHADGIRILLGAEPDPTITGSGPCEARPPHLAAPLALRLRRALERHERDLTQAWDLLGFSVDADQSARRTSARPGMRSNGSAGKTPTCSSAAGPQKGVLSSTGPPTPSKRPTPNASCAPPAPPWP